MSTQLTRRDPWRWPALLLWFIFFLIGLWPEQSFSVMRTAGYVFSQNAIVNSYHFITWCLVGFIVHFTYHRCLDSRFPPLEALGKSIQLGVVAFVAFVDLPVKLIPDIRHTLDQSIVIGMVMTKLLAWLYLYTLMVRYYWRRQSNIIAYSLPWLAMGKNDPTTAQRSNVSGDSSASTSDSPGSSMEEQVD